VVDGDGAADVRAGDDNTAALAEPAADALGERECECGEAAGPRNRHPAAKSPSVMLSAVGLVEGWCDTT
jgi:hypothetical protein